MKAMDSGGGNFDLEPGIYDAVCFGLIDVGTQHGEYLGEPSVKRQIIMKFELLDETYEYENETHKAQFSQFYTLSLHEKAKLRKHLVGWRGREFTTEELGGFEVKNVLGKNCVLIVGRTPSGKTTVESISKFKKEPVAPGRDIEYFSFDDFDGEFPEFISDGIKNICMKSDEYIEQSGGELAQAKEPVPADVPEEFDESDVPF